MQSCIQPAHAPSDPPLLRLQLTPPTPWPAALQVAVAEEYVPGSLSGAGAFDVDADVAGSEGSSGSASGAVEDVEVTRHPGGSPSPGYAYHPSHLLQLQKAQNFLDEAALYSSEQRGWAAGRGGRRWVAAECSAAAHRVLHPHVRCPIMPAPG